MTATAPPESTPTLPASLPVPILTPDRVRRRVVGWRPCRRGGLRLAVERLAGVTVVHHHGHGGCGVTLAPGSAELAADLVTPLVPPGDPVGVLGGGVVGLATAEALARRGRRPVLVAERAGAETTSGVAGAVWLPTGIDFPDDPTERARLNEALRRAGARFRDPETRRRWGVRRLPLVEPPGHFSPDAFFEAGVLEAPRPVPDDVPHPRLRGGQWFPADLIETPRMLAALADGARAGGARIEVGRRLRSPDDVRALGLPVVVSCLGLGAREVFGDRDVFAARGLLLHLDPEPLGWILHAGYTYAFPRPDVLVLGGTFDTDVDPADPPDPSPGFEAILEHHRSFFGTS